MDNLIPDEEVLASVSNPSEIPTEGLKEDLEKLVKDANDRLGIHLKSKTESDKKSELQANMAAFYNALKAGNITISQAINNPQFKNCAYLFIMGLMDEDMEGEIDNYLNQIL